MSFTATNLTAIMVKDQIEQALVLLRQAEATVRDLTENFDAFASTEVTNIAHSASKIRVVLDDLSDQLTVAEALSHPNILKDPS